MDTTRIPGWGSRDLFICVSLLAAALFVYCPAINHDFVNIDDPLQLTGNSHVLTGFTWDNLKFALGPASPCNPLTWFVYTLIHELFGLNPAAFHLAGILFHATSGLLLFFVLRRMTGEVYKGAFVSVLFVVHPMNVESVAWVAELNNTLSGVLFMLGLLAYHHYVRKPGWGRYCVALGIFELGLLAKATLMTFPFLLLLLDLWPLERVRVITGCAKGKGWSLSYQRTSLARLVLEKVPFLVLAAGSVLSTLLRLGEHSSFTSLSHAPVALRVSNAMLSYGKYLGKLFWPENLAVLYPYPSAVPLWQGTGAFLLIVSVTVLLFRMATKKPYLLVGWLWFLGTLVPFLGLVQGGHWPEMADRYAYISFLGMFIILAWGVPDILGMKRHAAAALTIAGLAAILVLAVVARHQVMHWKDSITLLEHVIKVNPASYLAHNNLGNEFMHRGDMDRALAHYHEAVRIYPVYYDAWFNLGVVHALMLEDEKAMGYYARAIETDPRHVDAYINKALLLSGDGRFDEATELLEKALELKPGSVEALVNLGNVMLQGGDPDGAIGRYRQALAIEPNRPEILNNLGNAYARKGNMGEAHRSFSRAHRMAPDLEDARRNMENAGSMIRQIETAVDRTYGLLRADPQNTDHLISLARSLARLGSHDLAADAYRKVLELRPGDVQPMFELARVLSERGLHRQSQEVLGDAIRLQPGNPDAYYNMACCYARMGRVEEAGSWLRQALDIGFANKELMRRDPDLAALRRSEFLRNIMKSAD